MSKHKIEKITDEQLLESIDRNLRNATGGYTGSSDAAKRRENSIYEMSLEAKGDLSPQGVSKIVSSDSAEIAEGYTVQGIDKINNVLALACGSDGILLYDILQSTDNLYANEIGRVETEYAYQVKLMSENSFLAATRAGVQYYSLDY